MVFGCRQNIAPEPLNGLHDAQLWPECVVGVIRISQDVDATGPHTDGRSGQSVGTPEINERQTRWADSFRYSRTVSMMP